MKDELQKLIQSIGTEFHVSNIRDYIDKRKLEPLSNEPHLQELLSKIETFFESRPQTAYYMIKGLLDSGVPEEDLILISQDICFRHYFDEDEAIYDLSGDVWGDLEMKKYSPRS